jgi:hypothetical protein
MTGLALAKAMVNPYKAAARLGIAYLDLPILGRLFTHGPKHEENSA